MHMLKKGMQAGTGKQTSATVYSIIYTNRVGSILGNDYAEKDHRSVPSKSSTAVIQFVG